MKYTRREFIKSAGGFVCASTFASQLPGLAEAAEKRKFNVLFLMADQHNHSIMGCAGNPMVKTPNLDKLAGQGARFTNAVCATPFCSPTRASLLTGLWPHTHGIIQNIDAKRTGLGDSTVATEQILFDKGYFTAQMGKWHLGDTADLRCYQGGKNGLVKDEYQAFLAGVSRNKWPQVKPGEARVDEVAMLPEMAEVRKRDVATARTADEVTKIGRHLIPAEDTYEWWLAGRCIDLLKLHRSENFQITWSVVPPHAPWIAPEPYYSMYDPAKMKLPKSWGHVPEAYAKSRAAHLGEVMGEKLVREWLRCYCAQVTMMDACVGRILKALGDLGLERDTLVVYLSDHGDMQAAHGMVGKTVNAYFEEIVRVPLIVRYPKAVKAGRVIHGHANSVDIMPTLLDYAGVSIPKGVQGSSLRPMLEGKTSGEDRYGFCERGTREFGRMIRTTQWKYAAYSGGRRELFDLRKDPCEMDNLADSASCKAVRAELHRRLRAQMERTDDVALQAVGSA